jgi:hypothetical protein
MNSGFIYCLSNIAMPNLVKVGMTKRTPKKRLAEANRNNTWIPMPYKIEFAKKVCNPKEKETTLHKLLEKYAGRINPKREFFTATPETVLLYFDLIDGEMWVESDSESEEKYWNEEQEEEEEEEEEEKYWKEEEEEKEISNKPEKKQTQKETLVGKVIRKDFEEHGVFMGVVKYYKVPYYRVQYEDGDCEDLSGVEVRKLIIH